MMTLSFQNWPQMQQRVFQTKTETTRMPSVRLSLEGEVVQIPLQVVQKLLLLLLLLLLLMAVFQWGCVWHWWPLKTRFLRIPTDWQSKWR